MRWLVLLPLGLIGCIETGLRADRDGVDPSETGDSADPNGDVDTDPPAEEICNGKDDDGDGLVDEGFQDTDGDGVADCVDERCELILAEERTVPIDPLCTSETGIVLDPWNVAVEWRWSGLSLDGTVSHVIMTPVIGNLTDTNSDGVVNTADVPNVAFVAVPNTGFNAGYLVVLDGETGAEVWTRPNFNGGGGIAMADVNGDGETEIVAFDSQLRATAVDGAGNTLWTQTDSNVAYPQATVADLDGNGIPEVIADRHILDGRTGNLKFSLPSDAAIPYRLPAIGDLDQDGVQEIVLANGVYSFDGDLLWRSPVAGSYGHWSAILDTDGDADAEVAMVGAGELIIHDHDGTVQTRVSAGGGQPGAPCVADFDGDGDAEIAWASSSTLNQYELDGTSSWSANVNDTSGLAACSGYDIDGDGAYEVLFADQNNFFIFDGATGLRRFVWAEHASGTLWEYPSVADVDNDGSAEIVIAGNNFGATGHTGITVFGHAADAWLKSGTTWHTHDFAVTNILPDGAVPATPDPWWQTYNVYRARPTVDGGGTDLQVQITDVCYAGCEDGSAVQVAVQISNHGSTAVPGGVPVSLFAADGLGDNEVLTHLQTKRLTEPVPPGRALAAIEFIFAKKRLGTHGFVVRVDADETNTGQQPECDEDNNQAWYNDGPC